MKKEKKTDNNITKKTKKKNSWIAAILNIIPGLGYLYLGRRKVFSYLLLLSELIAIIGWSFNKFPDVDYTIVTSISTILFSFAFMYDAFNQNKKTTDKLSINKKKKNPWIAAILNIIPGLGYLYLGKRKGFSYLLLLSTLISIVGGFISPIQPAQINSIIWVSLIIFFAFMYDAYNEARE